MEKERYGEVLQSERSHSPQRQTNWPERYIVHDLFSEEDSDRGSISDYS